MTTTTQREQIVTALAQLGEATIEEIGEATGLGLVPVARRMSELERRDHARTTGKFKSLRSGRPGRVWELA